MEKDKPRRRFNRLKGQRYCYYERRVHKEEHHVVSVTDPDPIRREAFLLRDAKRIQENRHQWDEVEVPLYDLEKILP